MIFCQVVFGTVVEGMDVVFAIGPQIVYPFTLTMLSPVIYSEDVPKGSGDKPIEDVVITDSGEVIHAIYLSFVHLLIASCQ